MDESIVVGENGGTCIDENGAHDENMMEGDMARQEAEEERKRKILLLLMTAVEQEDQEQRALDAQDRLRRHRLQFLDKRKKRRKMKKQWYCDPTTGKMRRVTPKLSGWWLDYVRIQIQTVLFGISCFDRDSDCLTCRISTFWNW